MAKINYFSEKTKELGNTGFKQLVGNKLGVLVGALVSLDGGLEFTTATSALTKADWEAKMKLPKNQRVYMLPMFESFTDKSTDDVFTTSLQGEKFAEWGKIQFEAMLDVNTYLALNLNGLNGKDLDCVLIDTSGSLIGITPDGTKFTGISCRLHVGKPKLAGQGEKMLTPVTFTIKSTEDFVNNRAVLEPLNQTEYWNPKTDFDGVYDVELEVTEVSKTGCKVKVLKKSVDSAMTTAGVDGLVKADFVLKDASGATQEITTLLASGKIGEYDLVETLANNYTLELVACSSISLTSIKIEGTNTITFKGIV